MKSTHVLFYVPVLHWKQEDKKKAEEEKHRVQKRQKREKIKT